MLSGPEQNALSRLAAEAVAALRSRGLRVATAEATTGGLIGHLLTDVPGSSAVFTGGVAPYSNFLKQQIGVPAGVLRESGAVSPEAADALARAVRNWAGTDLGLAETGIAGPTGDAPGRPVGLFYIAIATEEGMESRHFVFTHDRTGNRRACAQAALRMLLDSLVFMNSEDTEITEGH